MFSISRLLPRDKKFFEFLERMSAQTQISAQHLKTFAESQDPAARATAATGIKTAKYEAKCISSDTTKELCRTFITPFDREDIQDFMSGLYKIPKKIDKVREYLEMHELTHREELLAQIGVIILEAEAMQSLVKALVQGGKSEIIMKQAALLDQLENEGDIILSHLLVKLLRDTTDPRQLILQKDLYDMLEKVIDGFRNVAEIGIQIALKHN